jgi:hypothetical protein
LISFYIGYNKSNLAALLHDFETEEDYFAVEKNEKDSRWLDSLTRTRPKHTLNITSSIKTPNFLPAKHTLNSTSATPREEEEESGGEAQAQRAEETSGRSQQVGAITLTRSEIHPRKL